MVFKKSEYQNQFKSSVIAKNQSIYQENLTFRHERRNREFVHTPINWFSHGSDEALSSEEEDNQNTNCNSNSISNFKAESKSKEEPQYQSLAEILDASKAKTIAFKQQKRVEDGHSKELPDVLTLGKMSLIDGNESNLKTRDTSDPCLDQDRTGKIEDSIVKNADDLKNPPTGLRKDMCSEKQLKSKSNMRKKGSSKKKSPERAASGQYRSQSSHGLKDDYYQPAEPNGYQIPSLPISTKPRPRRPDRQRRVPSAKHRPASQVQDKPPFISYGAGDIEDTFTTHRTHNVRSTADVYGAALNAKIRREEEKKRQLSRQKRMAQSANDILEKLAAATPRDMFDWRSEYQKQFHGYEPREYERSCSSRAVIPHSAPIRAVHRGESLIVHVD